MVDVFGKYFSTGFRNQQTQLGCMAQAFPHQASRQSENLQETPQSSGSSFQGSQRSPILQRIPGRQVRKHMII